MNPGEKQFECLCHRKGYSVTRLPVSHGKRTPDFKLVAHGTSVYCEVKEYSLNEQERARWDEIEKKLQAGQLPVISGPVNFGFDGGLARKMSDASKQLAAHSGLGDPTILVLFSQRVLSPNDYQVRCALKRGYSIPPEISAVLWLHNRDIRGPLRDMYELYTNPKASVPLPPNLF